MRAALLSAAVACGCGESSADPGDALWTRTWEPEGEDLGLDVAVAGDAVVIAGVRASAGSGDDAWIARLDRDGDEAWSRTLDRGGDELAAGVALEGDGSITVAGAHFVEGGSWDAWVTRLDPDGAELWERSIAGTAGGEDQAVAVAIAPDGSIVAVGYATAADGGTAAWLAGFASDGTPVWTQLHEGPGVGFDVATSIALADSGSLAWVVGYETSARGDTDLWISTWDLAGNPVSSMAIDVELGDDRATSVAPTPSGGAWVSGVATVPGRTVDAWAAELDAAGTTLWTHLHDGPTSLGDGANGIAGTDDVVVVAGYEYVEAEAWNTWVRALDRDGTELWTHRFAASTGDDTASDLALDEDGAIYVVGSLRVDSDHRAAYLRKLAP